MIARKNVLVTGSFDCLHSGHIAFLKEASKYGLVYVGIGSDESIHSLKNRETICKQNERLFMIQAIRYVEMAWINSGMGIMDFTYELYLHNIIFDTLVLNEDQDTEEKRLFAHEHDLEYIVFKRVPEPGLPERSSTQMRKHYDNRNVCNCSSECD